MNILDILSIVIWCSFLFTLLDFNYNTLKFYEILTFDFVLSINMTEMKQKEECWQKRKVYRVLRDDSVSFLLLYKKSNSDSSIDLNYISYVKSTLINNLFSTLYIK